VEPLSKEQVNALCITLTEKFRKKLALLAGNVGMTFKQIAHPTFRSLVITCMEEMNEGVPSEYQNDPLKLITPPTDKQVSAGTLVMLRITAGFFTFHANHGNRQQWCASRRALDRKQRWLKLQFKCMWKCQSILM
jgi:hypothetical protein